MPADLEIYRFISDPIWGNIGITILEDHIINTDAFNRLRQIKQMSMAYIGHMGAQHTRYEHSIGCMHVAYSLASNLAFLTREDEGVWQKKLYTSSPDPIDYKTIRIAALLHDIGHAPLSHLLESAIDKYPFLIEECRSSEFYKSANKHDKRAIDQYCHEMFSVRTLYKDNDILGCLRTAGINPAIVAYLISGLELSGIPLIYRVYKSLISGDLDADRLDYINRDFYFCGNKQTVDLNLFANALHRGVDRNGQPTIAVDEASVVHAASFLFSRFMLAQTIHNNQETRINEQAFTDLIRDYLLAFNASERMEKILELHSRSIDADLLSELTAFAENPANAPELIAQNRNIKKRLQYSPRALTYGRANKEYAAVYSLSWSYLHPFWRYYLSYIISNKDLLSEIENDLARLLGMDDFVLDVITSKPSKMDLNVYRADGVSELINEFNVTIPHALMTTAFQSNALHIYGKKEFRKKAFAFEDSEKEDYRFRQVIPDQEQPLEPDQAFHLSFLKIIENVVINHLLTREQLPREIILLFVMRCLKEYVRNELAHTSTMWIKAESSFQAYLFKHFKENFFPENQSKFRYNSDIYIMSEKLVCWGLIDHVHKPIHISGNSEFGPGITKFSTRIDRNINQWGDLLVDYLCQNIPLARDALSEMQAKVFETQERVKGELSTLRDLQLQQKVNNEYMDGTHETEKTIKQMDGCVIKFV